MKTLSIFLLGIVLSMPPGAGAQDMPWQSFSRVGEARLKFLFWPVYEAVLYSPTEYFDLAAGKPFALSLTYLRAFTSEQLVEETQRQWQALDIDVSTSWVSRLHALLPDVDNNDTITLYVESSTSTFFLNHTKLGTIDDAGFSNNFAAIWLSEQTSRPQIRQQLLGIEQ